MRTITPATAFGHAGDHALVREQLCPLLLNILAWHQRAGRQRGRADSLRACSGTTTAGCLYDVVRGDERDGSIRPNQIIAVRLPGAGGSAARTGTHRGQRARYGSLPVATRRSHRRCHAHRLGVRDGSAFSAPKCRLAKARPEPVFK
jgi:hypothetical protein